MPPSWKGRRRTGKGGAQNLKIQQRIFEKAVLDRVEAVLAIDPDSKNVGLCGWALNEGQPDWVATTHVPKELTGAQAGFEVHTQCQEALKNSRRCPTNYLQGWHRVLVVVEGMRIWRGAGDASTKNPQSLVDLSFCGGMAAAAAKESWELDEHYKAPGLVVEAHQWKGSLAKPIVHSRLLKLLDWPKESLKTYCRPAHTELGLTYASRVNPGDWKHIMDAVGIAKWARDQLHATQRRLKRARRRNK